MPRMTGTSKYAPDDQSQPELISFVDYAPINNYETVFQKFSNVNNSDILYVDSWYHTNPRFKPIKMTSWPSWFKILQQPRKENEYMAVISLFGPGHGEQYHDIRFSIDTLDGPKRVMRWYGNVDAQIVFAFRVVVDTDNIISYMSGSNEILHGNSTTGNTPNPITNLGFGAYYQELGWINGSYYQQSSTSLTDQFNGPNINFPSGVTINGLSQFMGTDGDYVETRKYEGKGWHGNLGSTVEYSPLSNDTSIISSNLRDTLILGGYIAPNHNRLLGLPHILNDTHPTNLISPIQ